MDITEEDHDMKPINSSEETEEKLSPQDEIQSIQGKNLSCDHTLPKEVKAAGFQICADEVAFIVECRNVEMLRIHGGVEGITDKLSTSINNGISTTDQLLNRRKEIYGLNKLAKSPRKGFLASVWKALQDMTVMILALCAFVSLVGGITMEGWPKGAHVRLGIVASILLVVFVTAMSDYEKSAMSDYKKSLKFKDFYRKQKKRKVHVTRNEFMGKISIYDLLPGDIVHLSTGDHVPADGLFISGVPLLIDEYSLTGESEPVKVNGTNPFLLSGTKVQDGSCKMLVTTVGMRTQWGKLMATRCEGGDDETPLLVKPGKKLRTITDSILFHLFLIFLTLHLGIRLSFGEPNSCRCVEFPVFTQTQRPRVYTSDNSNDLIRELVLDLESRRPHVYTSDNSNDLIRELVLDLESSSIDKQKEAAIVIKRLTKNITENRIKFAEAGAIKPLTSTISSSDPQLQEYGVTAMLNLSLCNENKAAIVSAGAINQLAGALRTGTSTAKENASCALLHLSQIEENKVEIGRSGAIPRLVNLLENGGLQGKKDASEALYSLCSVGENKIRAVQERIMKPLVKLMSDFGSDMVDESACVLSVLVSVPEARKALVDEGGIPVLVEIIKVGSQWQKEIAVAILLQVCQHDVMYLTMVALAGAIPPLVDLSRSSTDGAKHKAEKLLEGLRRVWTDGGADRASTATEKRLLRCPNIRPVTGGDTDRDVSV